MVVSANIFEQHVEREYGEFSKKVYEHEQLRGMFLNMQNDYKAIHLSGYRRMPEEMYLNWLTSFNREREKYINKEITNRNKSN